MTHTIFEPSLETNKHNRAAQNLTRESEILIFQERLPLEEKIKPQQKKKEPFKWSGLSFKNKLLLTMIPAVVLPLFTLGTLGNRIIQQDAQEKIRQNLHPSALLAAETAENYLKNPSSSQQFKQLQTYLESQGLTSWQQLQLIDTKRNTLISPTSGEGNINEDTTLRQIATSLSENLQNPNNLQQLTQSLEKNYPIKNLNISSFNNRIIGSFIYEGRQYVATNVPNTDWMALTSIAESEIGSLSSKNVLIFALASLALTAAAVTASLILARKVSAPLTKLANTSQKIASGNLNIIAPSMDDRETQILAESLNDIAEQIQSFIEKQERENKLTKLLVNIAQAREEKELQFCLSEFLHEIRPSLKADRVVVYRLEPQGGAIVTGESLMADLPSCLNIQIEEKIIKELKKGEIVAVNNVFEADLNSEHLELLKKLEVKSHLITPIFLSDNLYGLLISHHCYQTHQWTEDEINAQMEIANKLGLALNGYSLLEQKQIEAEKQRLEKEEIQTDLLQLLQEIEGVSNGDLTVHAPITSGQIGIVADFFNSLVEHLRETVVQVKQAAQQVNSSVGQNENAILQLADEAIKQTAQIKQTMKAIEEMSISVQKVAHNAKAAAQIARMASKTAKTGGSAMDSTVKSILDLRLTVGETTKRVKQLGESSQEISKVVSLINQIAMQTNLLAINASIEAARAGEEGRGFAVVAKEVGELAVQSSAATKEIQQIVENIQLETRNLVQAMELGTSQVVEGTRKASEAKQNFGQIVKVSHQIDQLVQSISLATVSQANTSQSVTKFMKQISQVSEGTSSFSRQIFVSLQESVAIAKQLQASVDKFKVEDED